MTITTKQVVEKVREIARLDPDYIYRKPALGACSNLPDPLNPHGCIIGYALTALGFKINKEDANEPAYDLISKYLGIEDEYTEQQQNDLLWCGDVQRGQDNEYSWGQSIIQADEKQAWGQS